uniref:Competence protein CoiA nuclease-like domain-containing protein n=1 Tax=viral metagenome TaxID=1070528 RepID=A0A6C0LPI8_9ZZZZ
MKKCNINYQSQYAVIDNLDIHINEYIKIKKEVSKQNIKCKNGHQLICANGLKNKPYFRHKNTSDLYTYPMTKWHCEWQGNFPNTEVEYKKKDKQIKDRRADVSLDNSIYNLEFQHSEIELQEVKNRKNDYGLHNREIIWIIDGNDTIKVKYLEYSDRYYLDFISDKWKYESFIDYEYIFIDIYDILYKIYPKQVKNCMIDVEPPLDKETFIKYINENNQNIHNVNLPLQCSLYIKQQGAGNGKTFGLIQNIESKDFEHYKCFIIVTKQHSAKTVIYNELKNQIDNNHLKHISDLIYVNENNKYQISYKNTNTNTTCHILIATIDSLMYSLGDIKTKEINKFEGIISSIIDGYIEKQKIRSISCNGKSYKLNKEMCLFVDETQDLSDDYAKAIITIMRNKYIDTYIVGDRLQSITLEDNAFQYFSNHEFSYIQKKQYKPTNLCRRFYHNDLVKFINYIIPFSKYSLPEIEQYREDDEPFKSHLKLFEGKCVYATETNENIINREVEKILKYYDNEVILNNYKPNDFLIVTPFTKKNALVNALETAIQTYWINKNKSDVYVRYAVFHKSEEGSSINLADSDNSTRIVSIHTSKGDGRNVVFVIGLEEATLNKFSKSNNIKYDSLIHVALTRMKKSLYIRFIKNGDDISSRILKYMDDNDNDIFSIEPPSINIYKHIKYNDIIDEDFKKTNYQTLLNEILNKTGYTADFDNSNEKIIIDMSHHNIRYPSMLIQLYIKIINNENNIDDSDVKKQFKAIIYNIIGKDIFKALNWQDYYTYLKKKEICILQFTNNGKDYVRYYDIIVSFMDAVKLKLHAILSNKITTLCPMESIILYYMINITHVGIMTDITIDELYNIIEIYSKSFNNSYEGHNNCLCKTHFNTQCFEPNKNIEKMSKYLIKHYEDMKNVGKVYDTFLKQYPKVSWLRKYKIIYNGTNEDFKLSKDFHLIGYDTDTVFIIYVKPQFNELNLYNILIESIYDTFLIKNFKQPLDQNDKKGVGDFAKFNNKKILTVVFSLDNKDYKIYNWYKETSDLINNKVFIEQIRPKLIKKYISESKHTFRYYNYYRKQNIDAQPKKFIRDFLIDYKKYKKKYDYLPPFMLRFFQKIEDDISSSKNKKEILELYDDKDFFLTKLHEIIINSIDEYLDFDEDE